MPLCVCVRARTARQSVRARKLNPKNTHPPTGVGDQGLNNFLHAGDFLEVGGGDRLEDVAEDALCDVAVPRVGVPLAAKAQQRGNLRVRQRGDDAANDLVRAVLDENRLQHRQQAVRLPERERQPRGLDVVLLEKQVGQLLLLYHEQLVRRVLLGLHRRRRVGVEADGRVRAARHQHALVRARRQRPDLGVRKNPVSETLTPLPPNVTTSQSGPCFRGRRRWRRTRCS